MDVILFDHARLGAAFEQTHEPAARQAEPHPNLVGVEDRVFDEIV
jgi:hypothetical protein